MARILIWLTALLSFTTASNAAERTNCYRIPVQSPFNDSSAYRESEVWCYQSAAQGTFIFNADHKVTKAELAMLVRPDGTVTHGSLLAGKVTLHRTNGADFNPFSVPLKEPSVLRVQREEHAVFDEAAAAATLRQLESHEGPEVDFILPQSPASSRASILPWRGFWWPYKGRWLQRGPYAKFDRFVLAKTGVNPGAVAWEDRYHSYDGVWWEGHCNGWAAASVLRNEPREPRYDASTGIVFSVSDQKGYLTAIDYCANVAFFGERYRGRGNNPYDIEPALFHKTLLYYIGNLHKPVAIDYRADAAVDNHVISAYRMRFEPVGTGSYIVTAYLTVHKYDGSLVEAPGTAPSYTRVYSYVLNTDARGVPVGGRWRGANPDFLWVPLSPTRCSSNNQNLKHEWVDAIMVLPTQGSAHALDD